MLCTFTYQGLGWILFRRSHRKKTTGPDGPDDTTTAKHPTHQPISLGCQLFSAMADLSPFATSKHLLHTQEKLSRYRPGPGGFHPVSLGDTFKAGRYKVYHKLGWGGFSTVWLARDQSCVNYHQFNHPA
jgi:hypothetical protein